MPSFAANAKQPDANENQFLPEIIEDEPEGLIGRLQAYCQKNLSDIILLTILTSLTVMNFYIEAKLISLNFFYIIIFITGYAMGRRLAILMAFFNILVVWGFILSDEAPYLIHLSHEELEIHMVTWASLLILLGWVGSSMAKAFHGKAEQ